MGPAKTAWGAFLVSAALVLVGCSSGTAEPTGDGAAPAADASGATGFVAPVGLSGDLVMDGETTTFTEGADCRVTDASTFSVNMKNGDVEVTLYLNDGVGLVRVAIAGDFWAGPGTPEFVVDGTSVSWSGDLQTEGGDEATASITSDCAV